MATNVILPELGEGVTEGELIKYLVKPGDSVKPDQPVAEFMTDKATVEVPSPVGGVVKELLFKAGDVVQVEKVILTLDGAAAATKPASPDATANKAHSSPPSAPVQTNPAPTAQVHSQVSAQTPTIYPPVADSRVLATPSTRRLARELNVDINQLQGTGLANRVTREDVLSSTAGVSAKAPAPALRAGPALASGPQEERVPLRGIRKKIAENLQLAKQIIPHFTLMDEANVTRLVEMRESLKAQAEKSGLKVTYLPFVMKALISSCRKYPMFNASIDDQAQEIVYRKNFNIGFAADTPNGLVVPVIKNADHKTIGEISAEIMDLSKRARDGKLKPEEMKGATITITNIGSVGGTYATPIINHPEVAILGMYKISDRISLGKDQKIEISKVMNFTITADHRLIDGAVAANFLKDFMSRIEQPGVLMLDMI